MRLRAMLIFAAVCLSAAVCNAQTKSQSTIVQGQSTVTFSATPVFNANLANAFKLTLTGNVTSSTLTHADAGQMIQFEICQDGTGGRTFVPPTNVLNMGTIASAASACSTQEFLFDGSNAVAMGPMQSGGGTIIPGNLTMGSASTLTVANIKQIALTSFVIADPLGVSHFFVSSSSPYTNTFVNGNGAGVVFLGSAAKTSVDDVTGNITLSGSTSGTTVLKASAVAAGTTLTLPAATDTLVAKATTDTLTNKTLGGTTPFNRLRANQGTALIAGDFALSAGWGTTASVGSVLGTDSAFSFVVTSSGTGQGVGPTVTVTFHDGTWTNSPLCVANMGPGNSGLTAWIISSVSATQLVLQGTLVSGNFTPIAANTYGGTVICVGR